VCDGDGVYVVMRLIEMFQGNIQYGLATIGSRKILSGSSRLAKQESFAKEPVRNKPVW